MFSLELLEGLSFSVARPRNKAVLGIAKNLFGQLQADASVGTSDKIDVSTGHLRVDSNIQLTGRMRPERD